MIKRLDSVSGYTDFINEINRDPDFGDPMLRTQEQMKTNLYDAVKRKETNYAFGIFDGQEMTGLFVFLISEDESYIEMLVGLSKNPQAYEEIIAFLKNTYTDYEADFVYNPNNYILHAALQKEDAEFEPEQQKMVLKNEITYPTDGKVQLYSSKYREEYVAMHTTDVYWTADKVIGAQDIFRIILAVENNEAVGYVDITCNAEENEPYDIFVKPQYRRKGYARAMLAKAIELNKPHAMTLLVDVDNEGAIALYTSAGFEKMSGENNITAHLRL